MIAIIYAVVAIACLIYSIFAFQQKGPLLSTIYFLANKEERQKMKTKEEYCFIASVFLGISVLFGIVFSGLVFNFHWTQKVSIYLGIILVIYVFVVSVMREIKRK